jgi:hypothetical protein
MKGASFSRSLRAESCSNPISRLDQSHDNLLKHLTITIMSDLCIHSHRESSHRNHITVIASDDVHNAN